MEMTVGVAKRETVGAFRQAIPAHFEVGEWKMGRVMRHTIGWFDFDKLDDPLEGQGENEIEEGAGGGAPLSELADMMRRLAVALQPPIAEFEGPNGVLEWPAPLLPYQREGVLALMSRRQLLLADAMGLGKTIQAIAALRILIQQGKADNALIVCPASLLMQWRNELLKWAPDLKVIAVVGSPSDRGHLWQLPSHVKLVGYDTLRGDVMDLRSSPVLQKTWDIVILDEASRIKTRREAQTLSGCRGGREPRPDLLPQPERDFRPCRNVCASAQVMLCGSDFV